MRKKQGISEGREECHKCSWLCSRGLGEGPGQERYLEALKQI